ncbi:hypothetical protein RB195_016012 [Necator americanus]|uniref:Reverse transcriptase domain-containing protein n=1 Tax=Necator americanus TaxID=51031 RepID=A0ABR1E7J9_NECAM
MTSYLQKERIPDQWKTSRTVLIHKKGDRGDLRNYRPICLMSVLYKVFTKIILTRISRTLDEAQPQEQVGFRQGFSCLDHIQTVSRVIEVCREYRLPLVLTFVDYEKAFDSVETNPIVSALVDQGSEEGDDAETLARIKINNNLDGEFVLGFAVVGFIEDGEFVSGFEDVSFLEDDVAIVLGVDGEFVEEDGADVVAAGIDVDGEIDFGVGDVASFEGLVCVFCVDGVVADCGVDNEDLVGFRYVVFLEGLFGVLGVYEVVGEDRADVVAAVVGVDGEIDFGVGDVGFFDDVIVGVLGVGGAVGECSVDGEIDFTVADVVFFEGLVGLFRVKVVGECGADDKVPLDFGEVDFCVDGVVDVDGLDVELPLDFGDEGFAEEGVDGGCGVDGEVFVGFDDVGVVDFFEGGVVEVDAFGRELPLDFGDEGFAEEGVDGGCGVDGEVFVGFDDVGVVDFFEGGVVEVDAFGRELPLDFGDEGFAEEGVDGGCGVDGEVFVGFGDVGVVDFFEGGVVEVDAFGRELPLDFGDEGFAEEGVDGGCGVDGEVFVGFDDVGVVDFFEGGVVEVDAFGRELPLDFGDEGFAEEGVDGGCGVDGEVFVGFGDVGVVDFFEDEGFAEEGVDGGCGVDGEVFVGFDDVGVVDFFEGGVVEVDAFGRELPLDFVEVDFCDDGVVDVDGLDVELPSDFGDEGFAEEGVDGGCGVDGEVFVGFDDVGVVDFFEGGVVEVDAFGRELPLDFGDEGFAEEGVDGGCGVDGEVFVGFGDVGVVDFFEGGEVEVDAFGGDLDLKRLLFIGVVDFFEGGVVEVDAFGRELPLDFGDEGFAEEGVDGGCGVDGEVFVGFGDVGVVDFFEGGVVEVDAFGRELPLDFGDEGFAEEGVDGGCGVDGEVFVGFGDVGVVDFFEGGVVEVDAFVDASFFGFCEIEGVVDFFEGGVVEVDAFGRELPLDFGDEGFAEEGVDGGCGVDGEVFVGFGDVGVVDFFEGGVVEVDAFGRELPLDFGDEGFAEEELMEACECRGEFSCFVIRCCHFFEGGVVEVDAFGRELPLDFGDEGFAEEGVDGGCGVDGEVFVGFGDVGVVDFFEGGVVEVDAFGRELPLDFVEVDFCDDGIVDVDGLDVELPLDFGDEGFAEEGVDGGCGVDGEVFVGFGDVGVVDFFEGGVVEVDAFGGELPLDFGDEGFAEEGVDGGCGVDGEVFVGFGDVGVVDFFEGGVVEVDAFGCELLSDFGDEGFAEEGVDGGCGVDGEVFVGFGDVGVVDFFEGGVVEVDAFGRELPLDFGDEGFAEEGVDGGCGVDGELFVGFGDVGVVDFFEGGVVEVDAFGRELPLDFGDEGFAEEGVVFCDEVLLIVGLDVELLLDFGDEGFAEEGVDGGCGVDGEVFVGFGDVGVVDFFEGGVVEVDAFGRELPLDFGDEGFAEEGVDGGCGVDGEVFVGFGDVGVVDFFEGGVVEMGVDWMADSGLERTAVFVGFGDVGVVDFFEGGVVEVDAFGRELPLDFGRFCEDGVVDVDG